MDKGEGVRVNTPTREEQLYSKLNFERGRSAQLANSVVDLGLALQAEQQAHNALKEKLKTIEWACDNSQMCPVCFGTRIRNTSFIGGNREDCWLDKTINND